MLRFFRRPSGDKFELGPADDPTPSDKEFAPNADRKRLTGRTWYLLTAILTSGMLAAGLGALYLGGTGGPSGDPAPPRLLPEVRPEPTLDPPPFQDAVMPPAENTRMPPSSAPSAPPRPIGPPSEHDQTPMFHMPLQGDSRESASGAAGHKAFVPTGPDNMLAEVSHEATLENLRAQIAEQKLRKLKAELQARELQKNPKRLFKEDKPPAEPKQEPSSLAHPLPAPTPAGREPIPAPPQVQAQPEQSMAPQAPLMRVRMVMLEPKEALIEAGEGEGRGWFKAHEGQKFPGFVVTSIGEAGVRISVSDHEFFYPLGGDVLGTLPDNRRLASPQAPVPPRR